MPKASVLCVALMLALISMHSYAQNPTNRGGLPGNTVREFLNDGDERSYYDPINDTIHYKKAIDSFYRGPGNKVYLLTQRIFTSSDTTLRVEYFRDLSDIIDLKTYKRIDHTFFLNKRKVYMWFGTSDGEYAYEIVDADAASFVPFKAVAGGTDKKHVFYWNFDKGKIEIIPGADPKNIKVLCPPDECWNCGNCYFVDNKQVFFAHTIVAEADPKTFHLLTGANVDAADKHAQYYQGNKVR